MSIILPCRRPRQDGSHSGPSDPSEPTTQPQMFMATIEVWGDGITMLDSRDVYFLVPPVID